MDGDRAESIAGEQERLGASVYSRNSSQTQRTPLTRRIFSGSSSVQFQSIQQAANQERQHEHTRNVERARSGDNLNLNRSQTVGQHGVIQSSTIDAFHLCQRSSLNGGVPYHCGSRFQDAFTRMSIDQYVNEESFAYRNGSTAVREVPEQQRWQMQSQALRHLRSRLESLSRNERAISYCRNQRNIRNNPSTSITRIIMLAEALFEVLDELHNQNETLSARSHGQSPASLPAPDHIVKSFPTEVFLKDDGASEASQCYVCLMDYEEGDIVRTLPCQHKFHQLCIDKWLKEVHRVCPLCRGNVCAAAISKKS
ncbi:Receptor-like proteiny region transmembrane domain- and RING domain-containing protein 6 [Nymphaea thermarum]|nr:Receptor-like proteiny region transmembrane domain- and RING domain-containing protein 6 [Nymphaea thermarum]